MAEALLDVAKADLDKAKVRVKFGDIVAPFDGVVTVRNVHVGDFIRAAQSGGIIPLLRVERTDVMRVVVQMPDLYVPYTDVGDAADVLIDALPKDVFHGKVTRIANSEDAMTRTMRTEVNLPNPDLIMRNGMYGRVKFILQESGEGWTLPSTAMIGKVENGEGHVYVVKDGKAHRQAVRVGTDSGREVEILEGVNAQSQVVTRYKGSLGDGARVHVIEINANQRASK